MLEENSFSTMQNAKHACRIAREAGWESMGVSTSQFHQYRTVKIFEKVWGREVKMLMQLREAIYTKPDKEAGFKAIFIEFAYGQYDFFREILAIVMYRYNGWI